MSDKPTLHMAPRPGPLTFLLVLVSAIEPASAKLLGAPNVGRAAVEICQAHEADIPLERQRPITREAQRSATARAPRAGNPHGPDPSPPHQSATQKTGKAARRALR